MLLEEGQDTCPSEAEIAADLVGPGCGERTLSVDGPGELRPRGADTGLFGEQCCYPVTQVELANGCVVGRPYYDEGKLVTAESVCAPGWARGRRPAVRDVLAVVASDEARHAELAWKALRWMVEAGGEPVHAAVATVFAEIAEGGVQPPDVTFGASEAVLAAHGRIRADAMAAMVDRALREVVLPCGVAIGRLAA